MAKKIRINISGKTVEGLYNEAFDYPVKVLNIRRASRIEPNPDATWHVKSAKTGKVLKGAAAFPNKSAALAWEEEYYSPRPNSRGWKELKADTHKEK